jgi:ubiquitin-protein ligase
MSLIAKQIKSLVKRPIDGVRYVADKGSLTEIHAIITGPGKPRISPKKAEFAQLMCFLHHYWGLIISIVALDVLFAERTPFEGGEFHVKLVLGSDYPAAPPKGSCARVVNRSEARVAAHVC